MDNFANLTLCGDNSLWWKELDRCERFNLLLGLDRTQLFDLGELLKDVVLKALGRPDAVLIFQHIFDEGVVLTGRDAQNACLMVAVLLILIAARSDFVNHAVQEGILSRLWLLLCGLYRRL